jgi:hypothetical protein
MATQMFRFPSALETQAKAFPVGAAVRSELKGALIACRRVKDCGVWAVAATPRQENKRPTADSFKAERITERMKDGLSRSLGNCTFIRKRITVLLGWPKW